MTIDEASECYRIPLDVLREYEKWGLCGAVKKVMGKWNYDDSDLEKLSLIMTLHDIGFDSDEIESYMKLTMEGSHTDEERLSMLNKKRRAALDEIHFKEKNMEYRINQRTGDRISVIGIGSGYITEAPEKEAMEALELAYENGINYVDTVASSAEGYGLYGKAFEKVRDKMIYQVHFGAEYSTGKYGWTTDAETIKRSVDWQLKQLRTDYIDYGFIHCLDENSDWDAYRKNGALDHLLRMKEEGVVRHIGISSHTPELVNLALDTGMADMVMFSINPAYDYQRGDYANGSSDERMSLYRRCEKEGVGISVMKPFSGGQLLDAKASPFGKALTQYQCIQYVLDKPGVLTAVPGVSSLENMKKLLGFFDASPEERDYSVIGTFTPKSAAGNCVYCNHCHPCPAGLDIALINKYYDLAKIGDTLAADHYDNLEKHASDCIQCGHCSDRCPFKVDQMKRMGEIAAYFKE